MKRIGVYTTSGLLLTILIIFTVSNAKTDSIIPGDNIGKYTEVDYGGDVQLANSGLNSRNGHVIGSQSSLSNLADLRRPLNVKQIAVKPGETFTYRFAAEQAGGYWYHYLQSLPIK
ncbi:multicopper oxidase domain-containing protein [Paenibacillus sp. sptzw28]|nr:multicopper oxidase domain-containing protein [Paenibacillus sp. sptzw28]